MLRLKKKILNYVDMDLIYKRNDGHIPIYACIYFNVIYISVGLKANSENLFNYTLLYLSSLRTFCHILSLHRNLWINM